MNKNSYAFSYAGGVWYTMAGLSVAFNLDGCVIRKKDGKVVGEDPQGQYSVKMDGHPCKKSFKLLYLAVLAPEIKANRGYTLCLYNPDKQYVPENLYMKTNRGGFDQSKTNQLLQISMPQPKLSVSHGVNLGEALAEHPIEVEYEEFEVISTPNPETVAAMNDPEVETLSSFDGLVAEVSSPVETKQYYEIVSDSTTYTTEDGAKFPTKELADWHQDKVSKGKGNAQIVRDFNGGWQLAEEIFLQEVTYKAGKPYENFIDVMNKNVGILVQEPTARFTQDSLHAAHTNDIGFIAVGLRLLGREYTHQEAETINKLIIKYVSERDAMRETFATLLELGED